MLTPKELQEARRLSAERYYTFAMQYFPTNYVFQPRKNLSGKCDYHNKIIMAPRPVTRRALHIFLHECAHAYLHAPGPKMYAAERELQAEQWAFERMREAGIPVPRKAMSQARDYVRRKAKHNPKVSGKVKRFIKNR